MLRHAAKADALEDIVVLDTMHDAEVMVLIQPVQVAPAVAQGRALLVRILVLAVVTAITVTLGVRIAALKWRVTAELHVLLRRCASSLAASSWLLS